MLFQGAIVREDRDYDFWYGYTSNSLTKLCAAFNLATSGTKKEKAARLCVAWEYGFEPRGLDDVAKIVEEERHSKLRVADFEIPDPKNIPYQSWKLGPPANLAYFDRRNIIDYFLRNPFIAPSGIDDLNTYTKTVSFTLFKNGRVKNMKCHECESGPCTIVSAKCDSTMMNKEYEIWVALHRETANIFTGYCTCLAGLPGYCKHLFAVLFSLEFYSDVGETNPSCTSQPQQWGQPSSSASVPPTLTTALTLEKTVWDHHPQRPLVTRAKHQYKASSLVMSTDDQNDLVSKLGSSFENCGFFVVHSKAQQRTTIRTLQSFIHDWQAKTDMTLPEKCAGCFADILAYFTPERVEEIQTETHDQSANPLWFEHRL